MKEKIIILDGSRDVTGGFKSSLITAEALSDRFSIIYIVPLGSKVVSVLKSKGYKFYELPIFSLSKNFYSLFRYIPYFIYCSFKIKKVCMINDCSVIIQNDYDRPYSFIMKALGWKGRAYTFVRRRPETLNKLISYVWLKLSEKSSETLIAVSNVTLNEAIQFNIKKIVRVYNSIGVQPISECSGYPDFNIIRFVYLSNYMPGKGQREALVAFKDLNDKYKNSRLHFAGGDLGLEKNRNFKRQLEVEACKLEIKEYVTFEDSVADIESVFRKSHVALSFSKAESFSRICVESAVFYRPIIATRCGGPEEIVEHGKTGFLVDVDDINEMSKYMKWYLENPTKIPIMGKAANVLVNDKFSFVFFKESLKLIK